MNKEILGLILILMGIFQSVAIGRSWPWVINFYRVTFVYKILGDKVAPLFLHFLNTCIIIIGFLIVFGFFAE